MSAKASVLIPSAQGDEALLALARLLLADAEVEMLVADNGLAPTIVSGLRSAGARVVEMDGNAGFGRAVNRLAEAAEGAVLVVTNDDVEPAPGFVAKLTAAIGAGAEMAAGVLVEAERPELIETAGVVVDQLLGSHDYLHGLPLTTLSEAVPPPLGPSGAAAAFDRDAFLSVGGFDEGFFAYIEDVDLALRMRRLGARCELASEARALHATSATLGYRSLEKAIAVGRSRGYLMRKYGVLSQPLRGAAALAVEGGASVALAFRHRSLAPAGARVGGWRECGAREPFPPQALIGSRLLAGLRSRLRRQRRQPRSLR